MPPEQAAHAYAMLGEVDAAIACLETNVDLPGMYANMYLAQNPVFDSLRDDPRFERILERAGLTGARAAE